MIGQSGLLLPANVNTAQDQGADDSQTPAAAGSVAKDAFTQALARAGTTAADTHQPPPNKASSPISADVVASESSAAKMTLLSAQPPTPESVDSEFQTPTDAANETASSVETTTISEKLVGPVRGGQAITTAASFAELAPPDSLAQGDAEAPPLLSGPDEPPLLAVASTSPETTDDASATNDRGDAGTAAADTPKTDAASGADEIDPFGRTGSIPTQDGGAPSTTDRASAATPGISPFQNGRGGGATQGTPDLFPIASGETSPLQESPRVTDQRAEPGPALRVSASTSAENAHAAPPTERKEPTSQSPGKGGVAAVAPTAGGGPDQLDPDQSGMSNRDKARLPQAPATGPASASGQVASATTVGNTTVAGPTNAKIAAGLSSQDSLPAHSTSHDILSPVLEHAVVREAPTPATKQALHSTTADPRVVTQQITQALVRMDGARTEITLDPVELGRVSLTFVTKDDGVTVVISADRSETADLLRRHGDQLQRDLSNAGYEGVDLDFSDGAGNQAQHPAPDGAGEPHSGTGDVVRYRHLNLAAGLDIRL